MHVQSSMSFAILKMFVFHVPEGSFPEKAFLGECLNFPLLPFHCMIQLTLIFICPMVTTPELRLGNS